LFATAFIMRSSSQAILAAAAALFELAAAGPKRSRADASASTLSFGNSSAVSINIRTKTGHRNATAPYLYGWMFEDINHSGDGGLYGELLRNRAFEGSDIQWGSVGGYAGPSITWQENSCEALGMLSDHWMEKHWLT
jgi:alpha-N-arabinofuranosidase